MKILALLGYISCIALMVILWIGTPSFLITLLEQHPLRIFLTALLFAAIVIIALIQWSFEDE